MNKPATNYQPSSEILQRYAQILINFALNSGRGIKQGEVVKLMVPDVAKPLARELRNTVLKAGGQPLLRLIPTEMSRDFYQLANDEQLTFFPADYLKEEVKLIDHQVAIIADPNPDELQEVKGQKIVKARDSKKPYIDWKTSKENQGDFTWTAALWGTPAKAKIVGLSYEEYWQQIIQACFLDQEDYLDQWRQIFKMQAKIKTQLNQLKIEWLLVKGEKIDLKIKLGANRVWNGGSGRNIPSFEFFTSPDWHQVEGQVKFNQPLYRYGQVIKGVNFVIKDGLITKATAEKGERFLKEMLKSPNADKIGEFSLTDKRMSRITHIMAETLYDENIGGPYGNTHLAIGRAYQDCYRGNPSQVGQAKWQEMGFNNSAEHTDFISTTDRTVTAILTDGSKKIIYQDGQFTLD